MIKSYPTFNDFFTSSFCFAFFYAYGVVLPLSYLLNFSTQSTIALFIAVILIVVSGLYYVIFAAQVTISRATKLLILTLPTACVTTFPEILGMLMGSPIFLDHQSTYFNAWYGLAVAAISYTWAFIDAKVQFEKNENNIHNPIELWTINIYLADHSFEDRDQQRSFTALVITWALVGLVMVFALLLPTITTEPDELKLLLAKVCTMIPTAALIGISFMFIGQATRVLQLERKVGKPLTFRNYHLRLKWRHDYVKYHLPAPIRKLNLRLFNQHVEAHERLQKTRKA